MILVIPWTAWLLNLAAPLDNLWTNQYSLNNPFSAHTRQTPFLLFVMRLPGWYQFSSVQLLSRVRLFATPWTAARQASLSITNSWSLLILMSVESVMPSNHLILCHPLLLLPSNLSQHQGLFKWVSSSRQVAKVLEFQFHHQSFQWIFRTDFL